MASVPPGAAIVTQLLSDQSEAILNYRVEDLLNNDTALRLILNVLGDRMEALDSVIGLIHHLPPDDSELVVLVDCDVLRTYVECETVFRDQASDVARFFHQTTFRYALPLGAFREFESQIHHILGLPHRSDDKVHSVGGDRTAERVHQLEALLGIDVRKLMEEGEDDAGVKEKLDKALMRLGRLVRFFTDERFQGVYTDYDKRFAALARQELERRTRREGREKWYNENDGINLAIVLKEIEKKHRAMPETEPSPPHPILLTTTKHVVAAARELAHVGEHYALATYPNVFWQAAAVCRDRTRRAGYGIAGQFRDLLHRLKQAFGSRLFQREDASSHELLTVEVRAIKKYARDVVGAAKTLNDAILFFEGQRVTQLSINYSHDQQVSEFIADAPNPRLFSLNVLLDRLSDAFDNLPNYRYEVYPCERKHVLIEEHKIRPPGGDHLPQEKLMKVTRVGQREGMPPFFSVTWPIACDDYRLSRAFAALWPTPADLFGQPDKGYGNPPPNVESPVRPDPERRLGVVISTSRTSLGYSRSYCQRARNWDLLRIASIQSMIEQHVPRRRQVTKMDARSLRGGLGNEVFVSEEDIELAEVFAEIQQVRIINSLLDISIDISPREDELTRNVTISSRYAIAEVVARMYGWTGTRLSVRRALEVALNELLGMYPPLPAQ
jgi:hypothetical protein